ncbi:Lecithin:cholesterol/phospholipid:diacylglycerol acyltransferase, partial [Pavlovales sp. CCMP2436]
PVVLVPGDASNQLLARLDKQSGPHWWCRNKADWFRQWLTLTDLLNPVELPCWCDNMKLVLNTTTGLAQNQAGVYTRVPIFGSTSSLEDLDPSIPGHPTSMVWVPMVGALVDAGYVRNASLRGAPYDFRYSPRSDPAYFAQLEALIVETSAAHGGNAVVLVSHSLGCLQVHAFLRTKSSAWKSAYILRWVSIVGP